jgi:hypothetical protein
MIEVHQLLDITEAHHHLDMVDMMIEAHHLVDTTIEDLLLLHFTSVEDTVVAVDTMIIRMIGREEDHLVRQDVGDTDTDFRERVIINVTCIRIDSRKS